VQAKRSAPVDVFATVDVALAAEARRALYAPELRRLFEAGPTERVIGALAGDAVSHGATDARDVLYAVRLGVGIARDVARLSSALDAELAFPLADPRIAQTSAAVPARVRTVVRQRAALLQRAVSGDLPRDVVRQPHRTLVPGRDVWRTGSLRDVVEESLAPDRVTRLGLFDAEAVARLRAAHDAGAPGLGAVLWRLVLVSRWLDRPARRVADYSSAPAATSDVIASSS
jgi:asparagine synthase (glutamine-hydrolysing)